MNVSIAWIFDHIDHDWHDVDIPKLVDTFNKTTAEIEAFKKVDLDLDVISLVEVTAVLDVVCAQSKEWRKEITVSLREDVAVGDLLLVKKTMDALDWVSLADFSSTKDGLLGPLFCDQSLRAGGWKRFVQADDYIITIDNKSITHRPDLWGHRGLAREIAAMLDLPLKPLDAFLYSVPVRQGTTSLQEKTLSVENKAPDACRRFAGLALSQVANRPSLPGMALRLARVDSRPIDALVDMTNYVMLDLSQPMHAFDAEKIPDNKLVVRCAKNRESLTLLDDQDISLTQHDLVISDGKKPLSLAGVMGGDGTGVSRETTAIILESANFDATTIRRSSARHHVRTEASARFEKTLDPNQNIYALQRLVKLMRDAGMTPDVTGDILSLGSPAEPVVITVSYAYIQKRLGASMSRAFVVATLEKLGMQVATSGEGDAIEYTVTVPPFRSTKDITLADDLVEEIGRFFGYTNILPELPQMKLGVSSNGWVYRTQEIKQFMAYTMQMREVATYGIFDETFLQAINWTPKNAVRIQNPVASHLRDLVTTLVPNVLKVVQSHSADYEYVRFFELGRTWESVKDKIVERKVVSGVFYKQKALVDFYTAKALLERFFALLKLDVRWHKVDKPEHPWYRPFQTATIYHDGVYVGTAGKVHPGFMRTVCEGDAFIFELDADLLLAYKKPEPTVVALSKYPDVDRDISMLVPKAVTARQVHDAIVYADTKIITAALVDFFEKDSWKDKRSLTFRFTIRDKTKTLTKDEVDTVWDKVVAALKKLGATIR